jgi:lipopolysaccharide/colanic/teichoic acid biosynthesis glycosyltransferase
VFIKRAFDIFCSLLALALLSPLLIVTALLVKAQSEGPALFRQERVGRYGRHFTIYKFRTMVLNHDGSSVTVKGENRITPIGARLRKWKIDELPELWNILIGDMSIVGPRPDVPDYSDRLRGEERNILTLRPGLTSPASLKYSREEELLAVVDDPQKHFDEVIWPDKTRMNLDYVRTRSFSYDIKLIILTAHGLIKKPEKKEGRP